MDIVKKKKIKELNLTPKKKVLPHRSFNVNLETNYENEFNEIINSLNDFENSFSRLETEHLSRIKKIKRNTYLIYAGIVIYWISYVAYVIINHK
jgi:tetrahydromethanopterin S-methyltransferase subunit G